MSTICSNAAALRSSQARVLIVESLSPRDLAEGYREARATADILCTLGVKSVLHVARSKYDFEAGCGIFSSGEFDVLHLACHAGPHYLELTDGTQVPWQNFARLLGTGIHGRHLVMSMCHGGCREVCGVFQGQPSRPRAIIGPKEAIQWPRLVVAWQVYYNSVLPAHGAEPDDPCVAVSRVHMATGAEFVCYQDEPKCGYVPYGSCPSCAFPVVLKTYPKLTGYEVVEGLIRKVAPELIQEDSHASAKKGTEAFL